MGRQYPISWFDHSNRFEKLAEMGPVFAVLAYVCPEEERLRTRSAARHTYKYTLAICVVGICIVDEPLNSIVAKS